jgi:hypothetical protein
MNEEKITREEVLGFSSREAAENLSRAGLWMFASQQVDVIPHSPDEITRRDSNSETEKWQRLAHESQAPPWNQRR